MSLLSFDNNIVWQTTSNAFEKSIKSAGFAIIGTLQVRISVWATSHKGLYSAFHLSGVVKWVPDVAGKAKAGMAHSDCGWTFRCAGKTVKSLENTCHIWALLRWWFTTKRRYIKCMNLTQLPDLTQGHQQDRIFHSTRSSWSVDPCGDARQLNRCLSILAASDGLVPTLTAKFFKQLLSNVSFKQTEIFNQMLLIFCFYCFCNLYHAVPIGRRH